MNPLERPIELIKSKWALRHRFIERHIISERWKWLWDSTMRRLFTPLREPNFILYFLFFILGIGAIGAWIEVYKNGQTHNFFISLATFSVTLTAASLAETILATSRKKKNDETSRLLFPFLCLAIVPILGSISTILSSDTIHGGLPQLAFTYLALLFCG